MKVRITSRGITILDENEIRIRGKIDEVEIVLNNGREITLFFSANDFPLEKLNDAS